MKNENRVSVIKKYNDFRNELTMKSSKKDDVFETFTQTKKNLSQILRFRKGSTNRVLIFSVSN
jgi:hypothetical protein